MTVAFGTIDLICFYQRNHMRLDDYIGVKISYEHGDKSLPHLKDLISKTPDPMKDKIMSYLKTHCILACPGIIRDEIDPSQTIGCGDVFSDGTYVWNDADYNYVDRYNIPLPDEFRKHILANYDQRMARHSLFHLIDRVEILNNPYLGYIYEVSIEKSGVIRYRNNTDCRDGAVLLIHADDAKYIIDPMMTELFCYDTDNHGRAMIDGYHWQIRFYQKDELIEKLICWPHEDKWRYEEFKNIVEFAERYIPKDLGYRQMNFYEGRPGI